MKPEDIELVSRVPRSLRTVNGIPEPEQVVAQERAAILASKALADLLLPGGVRTSPLGPGWSRDIDLHLLTWPEPTRLKELGWIHLDPLLRRLDIPSTGKWAVMEGGRIMAGLDLHLEPLPDPVTALLTRCRRRGEVRIREVLEARELLSTNHILPTDEPVIGIAARIEAGLGGKDLARWRNGPALEAPSPLPGHRFRRFRRLLRNGRALLRPRLVVAISGVDGAGKSTLSQLVGRSLGQMGVPASRVWARPGMRRGWLNGIAYVGKRLFGRDPAPETRRVASGMPVGPPAARRGIVGWTWVTLLTLSFLANTLRQHLRGRGVLLYDRHFVDALVTFDVVYEGVDLRLHKALVRRILPKPELSIYLEVPAEVARARKPEDIFEEIAIRRQLESYEAHFGEAKNVQRLDGTLPADELAAVVIGRITEI